MGFFWIGGFRNQMIANATMCGVIGALPFFLVPAGCGSSSDDGGGSSGNTPEAEAGPDVATALDVTVPPPEAAMKAEASDQDSTPIDAGPACTTTPCVTELGVGAAHTCVRLSDGTARCWGSNLSGSSAWER